MSVTGTGYIPYVQADGRIDMRLRLPDAPIASRRILERAYDPDGYGSMLLVTYTDGQAALYDQIVAAGPTDSDLGAQYGDDPQSFARRPSAIWPTVYGSEAAAIAAARRKTYLADAQEVERLQAERNQMISDRARGEATRAAEYRAKWDRAIQLLPAAVQGRTVITGMHMLQHLHGLGEAGEIMSEVLAAGRCRSDDIRQAILAAKRGN